MQDFEGKAGSHVADQSIEGTSSTQVEINKELANKTLLAAVKTAAADASKELPNRNHQLVSGILLQHLDEIAGVIARYLSERKAPLNPHAAYYVAYAVYSVVLADLNKRFQLIRNPEDTVMAGRYGSLDVRILQNALQSLIEKILSSLDVQRSTQEFHNIPY